MARRALKAFVIAPAGPTASTLRNLLREESVDISEPYELRATNLSFPTFRRQISRIDFAVAVFNEESWPTYEVGFCDALEKPVLVIADPERALPPTLEARQSVRAKKIDSTLVRLTLQNFIAQVRADPSKLAASGTRPRVSRPPSNLAQFSDFFADARTTASAQEIESLALNLLKGQSDHIAVKDPERNWKGVDFALWVGGLEKIGNPLLVEVKAGPLTPDLLDKAELRLGRAVELSGSRLGLLLYLDRGGRRYPQPHWRPFVVRFDLEDLARELTDHSLADFVLSHRNKLAHWAR